MPEKSKKVVNSKDHKKKLEIKTIKPPKEGTTKKSIKDRTQAKVKTAGRKVGTLSKRMEKKLEPTLKKIKNYIFRPKITIQGKEPPKSFAFSKKFLGVYLLFVFFSFMLILGINDPNNLIFRIIMFGNPFEFATAILLFFITISFLFSIDKFRLFVFGGNTILKQSLVYAGIIGGWTILFLIISTTFNLVSFFLFLSMIWLILLSIRFYTLSRKISTKIEAKFISKYSSFRYAIAFILPFLIMAALVLISLMYRSVLVFVALEFFEPEDPQGAIKVYNLEMRVIMPLIYFSLVLTFVFIVFELITTRRKAETRRAGVFDNFTFSLMVLLIFFFQIFQVSIFLILRPEFISSLRETVGASSATLTYLFALQFGISMIFLYRIIVKLGQTFEWQVLFFKQDGLIVFFLGCVFAQTLTSFTLASQIQNQEITLLGTILMADKYIISVIMIVFIGVTLLVYYAKPHETSMFMRLQKETVKKEEQTRDKIYRIITSEYIRRGEPFPIEIIERELIKATHLSKASIYNMIRTIEKQEVDMVLKRQIDQHGRAVMIVDFLSVTEQFQKKDIAEKKAKKFLSQKLVEAMSSKKSEALEVRKNIDSEKASDKLMASLASDYKKKKLDERKEIEERQQQRRQISFKKDLPEGLKNQILEILKKEYRYRIENDEQYPDYRYPVSEIVNQISLQTRISAGDIYPILERLNRSDLELKLIQNPKEREDKRIQFFPIADDDLNSALMNFRPDDYRLVKVKVTKRYISYLNHKKDKALLTHIERKIAKNTETQKAWKELFIYLTQRYDSYKKYRKQYPPRNKLNRIIRLLKKKEIKKIDKKN
ncbi:MAG: hypothetical protein GF353_29220 [Candidatus Lokiarchaeota archaeon]|nr:hypothetical protein [Candidatus Lokiarchaeota archaeon]